MAEPNAADVNSRQIRVFLSSTFRDFMQERDLLVKQVFPALRRKAQERGVEVVDVDLRWGVTQEESEQGKVIGICLAEIDNCRPYFIGMLGERYGWIPPENKYPAVVLEQQTWLQQHVGGASVTELEILHGVLNAPLMAGRAFFYFRDPAWSRAQSEPGFVCDTPEEEAKLAALKRRILASDFPVKQGLPDPKAIADQIEADLWALIEEQYPDLDQADALEREARKHASYRQSRVGVYLGQEYVDQLEALVSGGEQKILITGESGSGKSALIANWMHQHALEHPDDVVHAHHLGCSNDANAIRPLLGRMLDTASKLLKKAELITETIDVPEDWWELTAKVAETLQDLGRWCRKTGHRWIWVLDGLDRLAEEDQQALPWLPLLIPDGMSVVISALDCPAKAIVQERQFQLIEIGPLTRVEQEQLIQTYLEGYTKKLDAERLQQILACDLARSPLFLRVLLEELRQCGRFETMEVQIANYIRPNADGSLAVNDLYARVLARLESDCGAEPVQKALTALWASRAGLSEPELLAITGLAPLQWAPIDLAMEKAFGHKGNRLVFDHDYLRKAVEGRYLPTKEHRRQAHSELADWYANEDEWDARKSEEMPWQLLSSERCSDLAEQLLQPKGLMAILEYRNEFEYSFFFREVGAESEDFVKAVASLLSSSRTDLAASALDSVSALTELLAPSSNILLETRRAWVAACSAEDAPIQDMHRAKHCLANALKDNGRIAEAIGIYRDLVEVAKKQPIPNEQHACALEGMALSFWAEHNYAQAEALFRESINERLSLFGRSHPITITALNNFATSILADSDRHDEAIAILEQSYQEQVNHHGLDSLDCLITANNLSMALYYANQNIRAADLARTSLHSLSKLLPAWSDKCMGAANNLAVSLFSLGRVESATNTLCNALSNTQCNSGSAAIIALCENAWFNFEPNQISASSAMQLHASCLDACIRCRAIEPNTRKRAYLELAKVALMSGDASVADEAYAGLVDFCKDLSEKDESESLYLYAEFLSLQNRHTEAIPMRRHELSWCRLQNGDTDPGTLISINGLAIDLRETGALDEAEALFRELLAARQHLLDPSDFGISRALGGLAKTLEKAGKLDEAVAFSQQALAHRLEYIGPDAWWTNRERLDLARVLHKLGRSAEATQLLDALQASITSKAELDDDDSQLLADAAALRNQIDASP